MRGRDEYWQNAANEGIVGVGGIEGLDCAVLCVKTIIYWLSKFSEITSKMRVNIEEGGLDAQ